MDYRTGSNHTETQAQAQAVSVSPAFKLKETGAGEVFTYHCSASASPSDSARMPVSSNKPKEDDEEDEENIDGAIKLPSGSDLDKMAKLHSNGGSGDGLLQWGQRKRSKRTVTEKHATSHMMLPPPPPPALAMACGSGGRSDGGTKLRPHSNGVIYSKDVSSRLFSKKSRNSEDRMLDAGGGPTSSKNGGVRSASRSALGKRSHSGVQKNEKASSSSSLFGGGSLRKDKSCDSLVHSEQANGTHPTSLLPETDNSKGGTGGNGYGGGEVLEWPRIYIALSRKEKEDDFFAMKGTKLPHRPKKRSKAVDRTLQYCFPGMWLSDLTKARYEVRERKTVKKPKRRGLKGLESMESDSD